MNVRITEFAAKYLLLALAFAVSTHVPALTKVTVVPETEQDPLAVITTGSEADDETERLRVPGMV